MVFKLSDTPIELAPVEASSGVGGVVEFVGWVRDINEGRPVVALEYEVYPEEANKIGNEILAEAIARFDLGFAWCVHRTGRLEVGEAAIRVVAGSGHRGEAFDACRWIVDQVKTRVPIWKKEFYRDGASEWLVPKGLPNEPGETAEPLSDSLEIIPEDLGPFRVIDIREIQELRDEPSPYRPIEHAPLSEWAEFNDDGRPTLFVCRIGARSLRLTRHLRDQGFRDVYSLPGGMNTLRSLVKE